MNYQLTQNPNVVRRHNDNGTFTDIPQGNSEFGAFLKWSEGEGNSPLPADGLSFDELKTKVIVMARIQRASIFSALDIMRQDELVVINTSSVQADIDAAKVNAVAIQKFIVGLRNITTIDLNSYTTEAQMTQAVLATYKAMAAAAPDALKPRFKAAVGL